jgi:predicted kinase
VSSAPLEIVVLVGLQGAGKSSFYRQRFANSHAHVSKDQMKSVRDKGARQIADLRAALREGRPAIVDNTNITRAARAPLVALARELSARVSCFWFDAPPAECIPRNHQREGRARVPPSAIWLTWKKLEPPSIAEGFDEIFRVRLRGGNSS